MVLLSKVVSILILLFQFLTVSIYLYIKSYLEFPDYYYQEILGKMINKKLG